MLQLYKNHVITSVSRRQVELRQLELEWYVNNLWTIAQQSALLAGFSFNQLTNPLPQAVSWKLECCYVSATALALGVHLGVLITAAFCCVWGSGLALKGADGSRSVHLAVDSLKTEQSFVVGLFVLGLISFLTSNVLLAWAYYVEWIASTVSTIVIIFSFGTLGVVIVVAARMRVNDRDAVCGKVHALRQYEQVVDLDSAVAPVELDEDWQP